MGGLPVELTPSRGELWSTSTGRTVEIVAYEEVEFEADTHWPVFGVIAYRFVGGSVVHLRAARNTGNWQKINRG